MEKLILLDFDGVLNSFPFLVREEDFTKLDPEAIKCLNQIIKKTQAKVVISSAWRLCHTIEQLKDILKNVGFEGEIIDLTPRTNGHRGCEILQWLEDCDFEGSILAIDDDPNIAPFEKVHLHTSFQEGLLEEHIAKGVEILDKNQDEIKLIWRK
jgi:phosphohistidine phosphatase SixA